MNARLSLCVVQSQNKKCTWIAASEANLVVFTRHACSRDAGTRVSLIHALQDIVTASPSFDVVGFVPALREYMTVVNPYKSAP